ncbi:MAG: hypothetical protein H6945_20260 [Zoogloeaceae bacterium]|nr:hypothetical protein [Rhodocyclaceae bacterium]MCP5238066.1 hypothetical protein [Zoogloeaceae bacterium]
MDDKALYQAIANEMAANRLEPALWTQAYSEAGGDAEKAQAIYIRLRHRELSARDARDPVDPLAALRAGLAQALARTSRETLYRRLGVAPDTSARTLAAAIAEIRARPQAPDAEIRYAIDILGDADARAAYDRSLAAELGLGATPAPASRVAAAEETGSVFLRWWSTRRVGIVVAAAVVALLAAVLQPFQQTATVREHLRAQAMLERERLQQGEQAREIQRERLRMAEQRLAAQESREIEREQRRQQQQFSMQVQAEQRRQENARRAEQRRLEQDQRQQQYAQQARAREERREARAAETRAAREARYWSCFNDALDRGDSAYAEARCGRLRY